MPAPIIGNAGQLRHRVCIDAPDPGAPDQYGQSPVAWKTLASVWAAIEDTAGEGLTVETAATRSTLNHARITLRHVPGLTVNHTIRFGKTRYRIKGINHTDYRRRWMQIDAVAAVA
jgi:SPP1 family predicted phage head-tail adaptor